MEKLQLKLKRWGITIEINNMVTAAVDQMQGSGISDCIFLRKWEQKEEDEKTWENTKEYCTKEYHATKQFEGRVSRQSNQQTILKRLTMVIPQSSLRNEGTMPLYVRSRSNTCPGCL